MKHMKRLLYILLIVPALVLAQQKPDMELLQEVNLVEAVYFHDNGTVSQKGTFNLNGELHGNWVSYSASGEKLAMGSYINGKKHGKWFFWDNEVLREVDYDLNLVASVQEWRNGEPLAVNK